MHYFQPSESTLNQSDPTASRVVDGYTDEMKQRLWNGMPQRSYTEAKANQAKYVERPKPTFLMDRDSNPRSRVQKFRGTCKSNSVIVRAILGTWIKRRDLMRLTLTTLMVGR